MEIELANTRLYAYTGGKPFNPAQPTVVMIHGVLNDHSVWILQSRYLAHHGWNVLALDLPGHGRSSGEAPATVEQAAHTVLHLVQALGLAQVALAGHSWGSLIALEAAARLGERASHLALLGAAYPMKVSPALLQAALEQPQQAIDMVNRWSHALLAPPPSTLGPGTWLYGGMRALMRRMLASNTKVNVFHRGFVACNDYSGGLEAAAQLRCPVLLVLGQYDQMTPPKTAQSLAQACAKSRTVVVEAGHDLMAEAPDAVLFALRDFLRTAAATS